LQGAGSESAPATCCLYPSRENELGDIRRPRILVLTPRDPYPVIGGDRLRIHRLARALARRYELTLLTFCESERERRAAPPDDGVFTRVHRVVLPPWRSWLNVLAALPGREPLQVAYYRSDDFAAAVSSLAPEHDVVLAHLVRTAGYARGVQSLRILEMTDAISMSMQRVASARAHYMDPRRLAYALDARRLPEYERRAAAEFDLVALTSAADRDFLFGRTDEAEERIMVVPNGVDVPERQPPAQSMRRPGEIAFVGNLASLQNFDAAWFFARQVLPRIRARHPDAVLKIIGPLRPGAARRFATVSGVRVEGVVPSLETALATARVGVCPVRVSSGMQNKVLDYFAHGLAVVCSPIALRGLNAPSANEHLLLADAPGEWAEQVIRLLEDEALAQRLADAGRALAGEHYRWDRCVLPFLGRLDDLLRQRRDYRRNENSHFGEVRSSWTALSVPASRSSAT
jgi:glycosyltransferase involved in cell wall biosynthesis